MCGFVHPLVYECVSVSHTPTPDWAPGATLPSFGGVEGLSRFRVKRKPGYKISEVSPESKGQNLARGQEVGGRWQRAGGRGKEEVARG